MEKGQLGLVRGENSGHSSSRMWQWSPWVLVSCFRMGAQTSASRNWRTVPGTAPRVFCRWLWLLGVGVGLGSQLHQCHPVFSEVVEDLGHWACGRAVVAELLAGNQGTADQLEMKGLFYPTPIKCTHTGCSTPWGCS